MKCRRFFKFLLSAVGVIIAALFISQFLVQRTRVNGDSMLPALEDGDSLLIDKSVYRFREPRRFEIVVFPYQYRENTYYIKRIIALPGETVKISGGVVYVNGSALIEHYSSGPTQEGGLASVEIVLGDDEYFVLGDNRDTSSDSRGPGVGNIKQSDIIGRAWLRIMPFEKFGRIE